MDFELTDDQVALRDGVRSFLEGRFPIEEVRSHEETGGRIDRSRWRELAEVGVFSLRRDGFGMTDAVLAFEELGRALVAGPLVETHLAATHLADLAGTGEGDTIVSVTWPSEPISAIEYPGDADVLLLLDPTGIHRLDAAQLPSEYAERPLDPLVPVAYVNGAFPPGTPLADAAVARRWQLEGAVLTAAQQLGLALGAIDLAVAYAKQREQFGRFISSFQAVKHMAADMLTKAEVARAAVYAAACALDDKSDEDPGRAASVAKLIAGEAALFAAKTGIQIHGGMGFTWEVNAQCYWKRAIILDTHYGNSDHHAELVAAGAS